MATPAGKMEEKKEETPPAHHPHHISEMRPVTEGAYGGGLYGTDAAVASKPHQPASETQSADGPPEAAAEPRHKPPPSTGDVDVDVTGQSYFQ
ncbi:hypothetical protein Taro_043639 [Colocasia esculenta]|uniref:Uncharacterized protein n=1 Tax=Colocasia esculenta TaxID=4460 RepID=A0A843WZ94_COLES|nr:hypothetical protein [Colocasia esculenta]